ncbi:MAG: fumarate hydratase [Clostridium sp.]|nr:fumarate hydratase [Clostridium sp.]MCM1460121.1 fumarate hydratase [Bacteroides sp.]
MRTINTDVIIDTVRDMCINANLYLAEDMEKKLKAAAADEDGVLGKQILDQLIENLKIAGEEKIPICQDTGMAVFFVNVGQDLHIEGMNLTDAINEGVRRGYKEGYLRKSVVNDPLLRVNTGDNTPAIIHYDIVSGDKLEITIAPKGFGSENMSKVYMLKPADGEDGVKEAVLDAVKNAGPNACPPLVVGVGLGGDFELAAKLAKKALTRDVNSHSTYEHIARIERELLETINGTGIGPGGLGGKTTALAVNIESYATHIAGMPLAVNMCCHVNRHVTKIL